jgi:hypothetical protein
MGIRLPFMVATFYDPEQTLWVSTRAADQSVDRLFSVTTSAERT